MFRRAPWLALTLLCAALIACTDDQSPTKPRVTVLDLTPAVTQPASAVTSGATSAGSQTATRASGQNTPARGGTASAQAGGQRFKLDGRAKSDRLPKIDLLLRYAERGADSLTIAVAFQNTSDETVNVTGALSGRDAVLVDAGGGELKPREVSDRLRSGIEPESQGFVPGAATVGALTFPKPAGAEPYQLRLPTYDQLSFRLDTPLAPQTFSLPRGTFPVRTALRGTRDALARIEMRINSVQVSGDAVTLDASWVNTSRQGFDLIAGPDGGDARLLDADGTPVAPKAVADTLKDSIAPKDGWPPEGENKGTLAFPLPAPEAARELRFVFPAYDTVVLVFNATGLAESRVTAPGGGAPRPTATPSAEQVAVREIEALLGKHAAALAQGDEAAYLATFDPAGQAAARQTFARARTTPLKSVTMRLAPDARLADAGKGALTDTSIELTVAYRGIADDNPFLHSLDLDLVKQGAEWRIAKIEPDENPPFWLNGDVVVRETPHFLIFGRPSAAADLPALEAEAEVAYAALGGRGLALEAKYVAFYTADQADFSRLVGRGGSRLLGVALARFAFEGDTIVTRSRAFYINGAAFSGRNAPAGIDRKTTVTHELVHLALAPQSRPFTPPWLAEGVAVFYAGQNTAQSRRSLLEGNRLDGLSLDRLTRAEELGEHDVLGRNVGAEYAFSGETVAYLVQTYGEAKVLEFYRAYAAVPASTVRDKLPRFGGAYAQSGAFADLRRSLTGEYVQQYFNVSLEQLDADVKAWVRT